MKIIIGTTRPFHLGYLAQELLILGHDVTMFGYIPKFYLKKYGLNKLNYISLFWRTFPYSFFALQKKFPSLQKRSTEKLLSIIDVIISNKIYKTDVYIGLSGMAVKSLEEAKKLGIFAICDRGASHVLNQNREIDNRLSWYYIKRELEGYKTSDLIVVPSIYAEKSFLDNDVRKEKIFINNYGVNFEEFSSRQFGQKNEIKNIVFVGNWSFQKGCDILSKAMLLDDSLKITHIGTKGDVPFPDMINFKSIGPVAHSKLPDLLKGYDALILPSRQDGFGMVLLEAISCGLPIIASKNSGGPDIFREIGESAVSIIDELTDRGIIKAIEILQKSLKKSRGKLNVSQYFSWKEYAKRYEQKLNDVFNTK